MQPNFITKLPRALGDTSLRAKYRQTPEDFKVNELLGFNPSGTGDHIYLHIEKRELNTQAVMMDLAHQMRLKPVDMGYAGRKDKYAVTRQWFSAHAPKSLGIDVGSIQGSKYKILDSSRHTHKLRTGQLIGNEFQIQLVDVEGSAELLKQRFESISKQGFPNYFGPQRFGRDGQNLSRGQSMLSGNLRVKDRNQRSMYLSACRSFLFNEILAERIRLNNWQQAIEGDFFEAIELPTEAGVGVEEELLCGPMVGDGDSRVTGEALIIENRVMSEFPELVKGIANSRVKWQRRPFKVMPLQTGYQENTDGLLLTFTLPKGCFATSLLRELLMD